MSVFEGFLFLSVGMDNFGGMNNMDRFGSSGMGRMNGGSFFRGTLRTPKRAWMEALHVLRDGSNGFISCIIRDGPRDWWWF